MPSKKLKDFLDSNSIKYVSITHSPAYTAQEVAASSHIPGKELAKTVIIKIDGKIAMAVLPAAYGIDFHLLKKSLGAGNIELAGEQEFEKIFEECETGAMPPFGNLYGLDVYADESLAKGEEIAFNAGTHTELVKLAYRDFERLVKPKIAKFAFM
ncbi:aminoacyl-tRNA deacylase [Candidatus Latescibacterota bacterium]